LIDQEEFSGQKINIYPVTRIQGRADIEVLFTPNQEVSEARFRALEFRGFERLVLGLNAFAAPQVLSRICGSCGPFHQIVACKAIEDAAGCEVPPAARKFRELLCWLLIASDDLFNMTYLALPDYALPLSDPAVRNVTGLYKVEREAVSRLTLLRSAFHEALVHLAGFPVHPSVVVPGGVSYLPDADALDTALRMLNGCEDDLDETIRLVAMLTKRNSEMMDTGEPISGYYAAVTSDGHTDPLGDSVTVSPFGEGESFTVPHDRFFGLLRDEPVSWSYAVPVSLKGLATTLVGTMARANIGFVSDTPRADQKLKECRKRLGDPFDREFLYFPALALEVAHTWEKARFLLKDTSLFEGEAVRIPETSPSGGSAVVDAPRGVLAHRVSLERDGKIAAYRIISPLQINLSSINECLSRVARKVVSGLEVTDQIAQMLQRTVRAFSPCVPCGTH
jgi:F420-non-reducing hydrogenase large subunit